MAMTRSSRRLIYGLTPVALIVALVLLWNWDWFIPFVEGRASAAIGRPVTMTHLHVALGRITRIGIDDVKIANPDGFPQAEPFAKVAHMGVDFDVESFVRRRVVVIPGIDLDHPAISALGTDDGRNNYIFHFASSGSDSGPPPAIGAVTIEDGTARVLIPKLRTDAQATIATRIDGGQSQIVVDAKGTYSAQPLTGSLVAGALLSLRDAQTPYPVDLHVANGPTQVSLVGTISDPLAFAGANLKLGLAGPNMELLYALTGIPLPKTPPYKIGGQLDYADHRIRFTDFTGTLGRSDLEGTITVDPGADRQDVTADLRSRSVDLEDLGGFIGSEPGRTTDPGMSAQQKQAVAKAEASPQLLPNTPLNLPKLRTADIHLKYHGDHIQGRNVPFDRIAVTADIVDGRITLHPITLGVGSGQILANIDLQPMPKDDVHAKADVQVQRLDVARLLAATHTVNGAGRLGGSASIDATGNSLAALLGNGNGKLDLYMSGGDLNAVLVDLAGLEFGKAVLSALGIPDTADLRCLIGQFALRRGVLETQTMLIDTSEAIISGRGNVDLRRERLDYSIKTESKHFSIGSLPAPIGISGPFKNPSIGPDVLALGVRGGAAAGLGVLFPPLALLPTIQLGVGDDNRCSGLLARSK